MNLFDKNNNNLNKNIINLNDVNIKKMFQLRQRNIKKEENDWIGTLQFSLQHNFYTEKKQEDIFVYDIEIDKFIINITPNGLTKVAKNKISGLEEYKRKNKSIQEEKEKEKTKQEPTIELDGRKGLGGL